MLPQAVNTARRITGNLATAEDAAAEALAKAYLHWSKLHEVPHREAWVLRVTSNEAIGTIRKQVRRERILRRQVQPDPGVRQPDDDCRELLVDNIRRLPRRQREVIMLRFFAELSTDEVAAALEISSGSVKVHLHRAIITLRNRLGNDALTGAFG